ncbi:MAG: hypothetical protein EA378_06595 [Phycisphaerales bacterium]|nr:MAG: hypothetical protein EA378_06595 [Phycisphaerales bacterium]
MAHLRLIDPDRAEDPRDIPETYRFPARTESPGRGAQAGRSARRVDRELDQMERSLRGLKANVDELIGEVESACNPIPFIGGWDDDGPRAA